MSRFSNMKLRTKIAVGATLGAAVLGGGGMLAFAYFTSTGSGSGTASVGSASNWKVSVTSPSSGSLYPEAAGGANVETFNYTVKNVGSGSQNLNKLVISVANSDGSTWTSSTTNYPAENACSAVDFSVGGGAAGSSLTITTGPLLGDYAAGTSQSGTVTLEMIDNTGRAQDNCQGVTVPLYFSAS